MQQAWALEIKGNSQLGQDRRGLAQPTARAWGQARNIGQSGLENRTTLLTNTYVARASELLSVDDLAAKWPERQFADHKAGSAPWDSDNGDEGQKTKEPP